MWGVLCSGRIFLLMLVCGSEWTVLCNLLQCLGLIVSKLSKEGYTFGKDKYTGSDTGSDRNKVNAIGDVNGNEDVDIKDLLWDLNIKMLEGYPLTDEEKRLMVSNGLSLPSKYKV